MALFVHRVLPNGPDVYFEADEVPDWNDVQVMYDVPNVSPPRTVAIHSDGQWVRYDVGDPPARAIKGTLADKPKPPTGSRPVVV